jgi:hypothetical protein
MRLSASERIVGTVASRFGGGWLWNFTDVDGTSNFVALDFGFG